MKRTLALTFPVLVTSLGVIVLSLTLTGTVLPQGSAQEKPAQEEPAQKPRRPLPKPVSGTRGFEQYAGRDASARLIAAAATRMIIDPGDFFTTGADNYEAGKYEEAVKALSQAVKLSPDWDEPHYILALSLTETGRLEEAIEEFKRVLKFSSWTELKVASYYNMANAYADLGQYEQAIEGYQQAIKLSPKLSKPHNNLGLAYAASGQVSQAVVEFNQAVQLKRDYAEAHYNLGVGYLQLGKKQEAKEQQQVLAKLNPELAAKLDALIQK